MIIIDYVSPGSLVENSCIYTLIALEGSLLSPAGHDAQATCELWHHLRHLPFLFNLPADTAHAFNLHFYSYSPSYLASPPIVLSYSFPRRSPFFFFFSFLEMFSIKFVKASQKLVFQ